MKLLIRLAFLFGFSIFAVQICLAQNLAPSYKPKNKTEKLIIAKIRALPEVQDYLKSQKRYGAGVILEDVPDSTHQFYSVKVGLNKDLIFLTYWRFFIDPKTYRIYLRDMFDEERGRITLKQWRYWRHKPEFSYLHKWVNGKLVVSKD